MKDRSRFHCMLDWSHIAAAIFKVCLNLLQNDLTAPNLILIRLYLLMLAF